MKKGTKRKNGTLTGDFWASEEASAENRAACGTSAPGTPSAASDYAEVRLLDIPFRADRPYLYYLPPDTPGEFRAGSFVTVPFGGGNRQMTGVITRYPVPSSEPLPARCKPIGRLVSEEFRLDGELLGLCAYLAETCICTFGDAVRTVLPSGALRRLYDKYIQKTEREAEFLLSREAESASAAGVWRYLTEHGGSCRRDRLLRECGAEWERAAEKLVRRGYIVRETLLSETENLNYSEFYSCAIEKDDLLALAAGNALLRKKYGFRRRSPVYPVLLRRLAALDGAEISHPDLIDAVSDDFYREAGSDPLQVMRDTVASAPHGDFMKAADDAQAHATSSADCGTPTREDAERLVTGAVRALRESGFLTVRREDAFRDPYAAVYPDTADAPSAQTGSSPAQPPLNEEQTAACETLFSLLDTQKAHAALLYGVTGSGKTRVMQEVMDRVISGGRQVILLVPEISLTPQSTAIFRARYGSRCAVIHSGLSAGERIDVWRRARRGDLWLVIGTRSAVFAPLPSPGLIILDEEQEHTYKSDQTPRYHARDAARWRCAHNNALLLLASATPSFESYAKAQAGIYTLITLKNRWSGAPMPEVTLADMHEEVLQSDGEVPLGQTLSAALAENAARGEQSIFFINRRGYQKYIQCLSCRETVTCPNCSVPMALHARTPGGKIGRTPYDGFITGILVCHYCGSRAAPPIACPSCGSAHLQPFGYGTQLAEADIAGRFPDVRVLRMDADAVQGKLSHDTLLSRFRRHEADLLLGTQMVTKGHDFPDVTLVGVLNADALLHSDDFRASERAFSLITQVIGRAGRAGKRGRAVIQTFDPQNEVLQLAARQDYDAFYRSAIGLRRALVFPPFCDLVVFSVSGPIEADVQRTAQDIVTLLEKNTAADGDYSDVENVLFGPFEAQIYRVMGKYRMRVIVKCRLNRRSRALFSAVYATVEPVTSASDRVFVSVDCNPTNL